MEFRPRYPLGPVVEAGDHHALRPVERIRGAQHPSILLRRERPEGPSGADSHRLVTDWHPRAHLPPARATATRPRPQSSVTGEENMLRSRARVRFSRVTAPAVSRSRVSYLFNARGGCPVCRPPGSRPPAARDWRRVHAPEQREDVLLASHRHGSRGAHATSR